ncbi:ATPase [Candidatus Woesearchaeota archaeon CG10_big_fil_rev_8_21_14_0_10_32_9]|nr:MAG: ATPase [Candidatus Woesearchaeota archaeon CG10_big_fil_rev_8_21_14_0_10_32_9]
MVFKAQILGGRFGEIIARQKSDSDLEIGELLVDDNAEEKTLMQVVDLQYGSQISMQNLEKISGFNLEDDLQTEFFNNKNRNYKLAILKNVLSIRASPKSSKKLPEFFGKLRDVTKEDLSFLTKSDNPFFFGNLRSGTKTLDLPVFLDGSKVLSHHILITGTTGKGKSVLMKNLLWNAASLDYCSMLVFDPHDEYFGRKEFGLKDFSDPNKIIYFTSRTVPPGQRTLKVNLKLLRPDHFDFLDLSSPQRQVMYLYYKKHKSEWIKALLNSDSSDISSNEVNEMSVSVVKRRLKLILDISVSDSNLICSGVFDETSGATTISDLISFLESGKLVIVDTSNFSGTTELLLASLITSEVFHKYKDYNTKGLLNDKPVISIVLEEAPRVLGKNVLDQGPNIFSTIAREGRKFKTGLVAITQLPSLIPKEILANMNTKIIMGTEMSSERQAIIDSASQDLSADSRNIASLDKGEAIISSNFSRFAIPIKIPMFDESIKKVSKSDLTSKNSFSGIKL